MKTTKDEQTGAHAAEEKGEKVRHAIAEMLSSEERGTVPDREDDSDTLSSRHAGPTSGGTPAEIAAQKRLTEIEKEVGKLVNDPELEQDARARSKNP